MTSQASQRADNDAVAVALVAFNHEQEFVLAGNNSAKPPWLASSLLLLSAAKGAVLIDNVVFNNRQRWPGS
jgi:hypothetical protein